MKEFIVKVTLEVVVEAETEDEAFEQGMDVLTEFDVRDGDFTVEEA